MKTKLLTVLLLAASAAFAQRFSVGVGIGAPGYYPPAGVYGAPCGPGSVWIDGYNDGNGYWVDGYCAVPPYGDAYWVGPGYFGGRFIGGYWAHRGDGFRGGYGNGYGFRGGYANGFRSGYGGGGAQNFRGGASAQNFRGGGGGAQNFSGGGGGAQNFRGGGGGAQNFRGGGGFSGHGGGGGRTNGGGGHGGRR
jgi:hypothetical protein